MESNASASEDSFMTFTKGYLIKIITTPLVCPRCGQLPLMSISKEDPLQVRFYCFCSYEYYVNILKLFQVDWIDSMTWDDFLKKGGDKYDEKQIKDLETKRLLIFQNCLKIWEELIESGQLYKMFKIEIIPKCAEHKDNKVEFFCTECAKHICRECYEENHKDHFTKELSKIIDKKEINDKFEIFKEVKMFRILHNVNMYKEIDAILTRKIVLVILEGRSIGLEESKKLGTEKGNLAQDVKISGRVIDCMSMLITFTKKLYTLMGDPTNYIVLMNLKELTHLCLDNNKFTNPVTERSNVKDILIRSISVSKYILSHLLIQAEEDPDFFKKYELLSGDIALNIKTIKVDKSREYGKHKVTINCLLVLGNGNILVGGNQPIIKMFHKDTMRCEMKYDGHTDAVNSLIKLDEKSFFSCSDDNTIIKWENKTALVRMEFMLKLSSKLADKEIIREHTGKVIKLVAAKDNKFVSCSEDKSIIIWKDSKVPFVIKKLYDTSDSKFISIVVLENDLLMSASTDRTLRYWDLLELRKLNLEIKDVECFSVNSMKLLNTKILLVGGSRGVTIVDVKKAIVKQRYESDDLMNISSFLIVSKASFLTGGEKYFCEYEFKISETKLLVKIPNSHSARVTCLENKDDFHFISAGYDSGIKTWMFDFDNLEYKEKKEK